jgi:hypothetical protein
MRAGDSLDCSQPLAILKPLPAAPTTTTKTPGASWPHCSAYVVISLRLPREPIMETITLAAVLPEHWPTAAI